MRNIVQRIVVFAVSAVWFPYAMLCGTIAGIVNFSNDYLGGMYGLPIIAYFLIFGSVELDDEVFALLPDNKFVNRINTFVMIVATVYNFV